MILASASPQRRAILERLGAEFTTVPADVVEIDYGDPAAAARANARAKAQAVAACEPEAAVIGADTVVALGLRILPKPRDENQARDWLRMLSGRTHEVLGGICVAEDGQATETLTRSQVTFRTLSEEDVAWYLRSGEWRDRAGAYAVQGLGAALVERLEGDYYNVVGLSVQALGRLVPGLPSERTGHG